MKTMQALRELHNCSGLNLIADEYFLALQIYDQTLYDISVGIFQRVLLTCCELLESKYNLSLKSDSHITCKQVNEDLKIHHIPGAATKNPLPNLPNEQWKPPDGIPVKETTMAEKGFKLAKKGKKLFVKNISFQTSQHDLWDFFKSFGPVDFVQLLKNEKQRSRGIGFVCFSDIQTAEKVLKLPASELVFHDRQLYIEPAVWKGRTTQDLPKKSVLTIDPTKTTPTVDESEIHRDDTATEDKDATDKSYHISDLNNDIMYHIFSYLTIRERCRVERVCRRWQDISLRMWSVMTSLDFKGALPRFGGLNDRTLNMLLRRTKKQLKSLDVAASPRGLTARGMEAIANHCPNVISLDLSGITTGNGGMKTIAESCPNIEVIKLKNCHSIGEKGLWWLFHKCKNLKHVDLENNQRLTGQCLHVLCSKLQYIKLNECRKLIDLGVSKLCERSKNLQELYISECQNLSDQSFEFIGKNLKLLRKLEVNGTYRNVTTTGLLHVKLLENLGELHASQNIAMNDSVLEAISNHCTKLRVVNVSGCHRYVTDVGIQVLSRCLCLENLNISYLEQVHDDSMQVLAVNTRLQILSARGCPNITDEGLAKLAELCHSLEEVDISGCHQITKKTALAFIENEYESVLNIVIGGTSIITLDLPHHPNVVFSEADYSSNHLRPGLDHLFYSYDDGDQEEDWEDSCEEHFHGAGDGYHEQGYCAAEDYLDGDDPLYEEDFEFS